MRVKDQDPVTGYALPRLDNAARPTEHITVAPIAAAMGAEVSGIDLGRLDDHPAADECFAEIEAALYRHGMLVFRGQTLDHASQEAFTLRFGSHGVDAYTQGVEGFRDVQPVIREPGPPRPLFFGASWHTDSPFLERPPSVSVLRSVEVPPFGGDTMFASTRLAFDCLSKRMQEILEPLDGLYTKAHMVRAQEFAKANPELPFEIAALEGDLVDATAHPLVRTHPVTGAKALYVDANYTVGIAGLSRCEAAPILGYLVGHITQPLFTCRLRWEANSLAVWDNRLVLHQAFDDFEDHRREMYRTTVLGEIPA